ncbi:MAG: flagellar biosynthesis anti-sigma factor FlgM [Sporolactobacillus sp.]
MKVEGYQPLQQIYGNYVHTKIGDTDRAAVSASDKLEISNAARQMQQSQKIDETRSKRLNDLKAQVSAGSYHVDAQAIATKMFDFWNQQ